MPEDIVTVSTNCQRVCIHILLTKTTAIETQCYNNSTVNHTNIIKVQLACITYVTFTVSMYHLCNIYS